jgi:hypothetical protein
VYTLEGGIYYDRENQRADSAIRDSGETNMFDTSTVQYIANREGYYELVIYLEEHSKEYWHFIMTGSEE